MTVAAADVYAFMKVPEPADPAQVAMMDRFVAAAEEWFTEFYSVPVDEDDVPVSPRPVAIDLAIIMKAAKLSKRQQSPEGVLAVADFGPIRVSRSDPDIDALIAAYRVYRVGASTAAYPALYDRPAWETVWWSDLG